MNDKLAPMLFAKKDLAAAKTTHTSEMASAKPSPEAQSKARTKKTSDGACATSFQSLICHLAQLGKLELVERNKPEKTSRMMLQTLSPKQKKAFRLLGVSHQKSGSQRSLLPQSQQKQACSKPLARQVE